MARQSPDPKPVVHSDGGRVPGDFADELVVWLLALVFSPWILWERWRRRRERRSGRAAQIDQAVQNALQRLNRQLSGEKDRAPRGLPPTPQGSQPFEIGKGAADGGETRAD